MADGTFKEFSIQPERKFLARSQFSASPLGASLRRRLITFAMVVVSVLNSQ